MIVVAVTGILRADPQTSDAEAAARRLATQLRSRQTKADRVAPLVEELTALGPAGVAAIEAHVRRELERLEGVGAARPTTAAIDDEIAGFRTTLRRLREDSDLSKKQLEETGLPALESLTVAWGRRESALGPWRRKRDLARGQAERLAVIIEAWADTDADLRQRVEALRVSLGPDDPEAARVFAENEAIAATLPAELLPGMTAVNTIRITCGLAPLIFDPKLCKAAAMHSGDMESHSFFAHESPLPGKTTPWDRAEIAGTTASGENIYMGSTVGSDAIKAWFLSPGHHKNMFGDGHARQGLGRAGKYWTQLFGS